jgi:predicted NAD/FAD-dependent oxidoreductase
MTTCAIIGAGMSGLAAAHTLQDAGNTVTIFEQTGDVGGRATTQQREGYIYDSGAQYIKPGPVSTLFVTERFASPDLVDIPKPVWAFDQHGHIQEGDPLQNAEAKWSYRSGLIALARRMVEGLHVHLDTPIARVQYTARGWQLFSQANQPFGPFDRLLITIPAPQAADLIAVSILPDSLQEFIVDLLRAARYNPIISVMLGYAPAPRERPCYALVNTDKAHPISWLAWEHEKSPDRVPPGAGLLIAQMAPAYSRQHHDTADEEVIHDTISHVVDLLREPLPAPVFTAIQRWPLALPSQKANADALNALTLPLDLAFCGDSFTGGRVHLALEHGVNVAKQLAQHP